MNIDRKIYAYSIKPGHPNQGGLSTRIRVAELTRGEKYTITRTTDSPADIWEQKTIVPDMKGWGATVYNKDGKKLWIHPDMRRNIFRPLSMLALGITDQYVKAEPLLEFKLRQAKALYSEKFRRHTA